MTKSLILGLGNTLRGDDGVGAAVIAALRSHGLPPHVTAMDGGMPGLETVLIWQGYDRVFIIDAAAMGLAPGEWRRFLPGEAVLPVGEGHLQGTLHNAGLAEALALAEALEMLPPQLIFFCVQPEYLGWSSTLTDSVRSSIQEVVKALAAEL